ncbi:hypothetical protein ACIQU4_35935 [Streptomyces sp. NPDC090741]|uniref:hypothetical protein n=1 Tax=Streptomyces sp. NPDC090741 TaxID=3365967 RepID=UPI00380E543E
MRRSALLAELKLIAEKKDLDLIRVRVGPNTALYVLGTVQLTVPRRAEINDITAARIIEEASRA